MPRNTTATDALIADFTKHVAELLDGARDAGRAAAFADVRSLLDGGTPKRGRGRASTADDGGAAPRKVSKRASTKSGKSRKNPWAGLSDEARLARVNAIRVGRGLPPKPAPGGSAAASDRSEGAAAPTTRATKRGRAASGKRAKTGAKRKTSKKTSLSKSAKTSRKTKSS